MQKRRDEARERYEAGLSARSRGELALARGEFERALELAPGYLDALNELGRLDHEAGDFAAAERRYLAALVVDPGFYFAHYNLGILHRDAGDDARARLRFEEAERLHPGDPDAPTELGRLHWRAKALDRAEATFRAAAARFPDAWRPAYNLGLLLFELGRFADALEPLERAAGLHPGDPDVQNEAGRCHYELGASERALDRFRRATELSPDFPHALHNAGLALRRLGRVEEARRSFERAAALDPPHPFALVELGNLAREAGRPDEAERHFARARAADPASHLPCNNLGLLRLDRRDFAAARALFRDAIERAPSFAPAHNNLGLCDLEERRHAEARAHFLRALRHDPGYVAAIYNLGLCALEEGDRAAAEREFRRALALAPAYPYACFGLGRAAAESGDRDGAVRWHRRALALDPRFALSREALRSLGEPPPDPPPEQDPGPSPEPPADPSPGPGAPPGETPGEAAGGSVAAGESFVDRIGRDLTRLAREGRLAECVGREKEVREVVEVLYRRFKNNPLLLGPAGVGKTAIVEGLARRIASGECPDALKRKRIVELNTGLLVAGTQYRGQFEGKVQRIVEEAKADPDLVLFIDEVHTLVGAGRVEGGNLDIAQMFKPALARGEMSVIGATTLAEYRRHIEKDAALERRFHPIAVEEMTPADTAVILERGLAKANEYYDVEATRETVATVVDLASRHLRKRHNPDKSIDLFEKTLARVSLEGRRRIEPRDVKAVVGEMAGIGFVELDAGSAETLRELAGRLKADVIGQEAAVDRVCAVLRVAKRRLDLNPESPDGVFLFVGPTGVGKTHFAKRLAHHLFGRDERLIRVDMSELSERHAVSKIVGAPPGYVGYDDEPPLTSKVEEHPASVVLLDEVEKAHPEVLRLFLQIFDEGRVTDSKGRKILFSDTTIVMTSNAVAKAKGALGFATGGEDAAPDGAGRAALADHFPKEFLNRIDEIIVFRPLGRDDAERILVGQVMARTVARFAEEGIALAFDPSVVAAVVDAGFDPEYGARDLERAFEKLVVAPLAARLDDFARGALRAVWKNGGLVLEGES